MKRMLESNFVNETAVLKRLDQLRFYKMNFEVGAVSKTPS